MMKRRICLIAALLLAMVVLTGGFFGVQTKHEGGGYRTPEDAAKAYFNYMVKSDVQGMVSTYAIETWAEKLDADAYFARMKVISPMMLKYRLMASDETAAQSLAAEMVRGDVVQMIANRYCILSAPSYEWTMDYYFRDDEVGDAMAENKAMFSAAHPERMKLTEIARIDLRQFAEQRERNYEGFERNVNENQAIYGYDESAEICVTFARGEDQFQLFLQCVRYGNRWYIAPATSYVALWMGMEFSTSGLTTEKLW